MKNEEARPFLILTSNFDLRTSVCKHQDSHRHFSHSHRDVSVLSVACAKRERAPVAARTGEGGPAKRDRVRGTPHPPSGHLLPASGEKDLKRSFELLSLFFRTSFFSQPHPEFVTNAIGVALPADADRAHLLVGRAADLARELNARWVAFIISNDPDAIIHAELAMRLGGTVFVCEGEDVAQTLLALATREQLDVLILGAPTRSGLLARFRRGVIDRVVRSARSFDVIVIGNA